jgi:hypothetical protein
MTLFEQIALDVLNEYNFNFGLSKNGGQKDFKKIAQKGIEANPLKKDDGSDFSFGDLLNSVPGARYPRENRADMTDGDDNPQKTEDDILYMLGFGETDYKDKFLFAYGVHRMIYDAEIKTNNDKKTLSNICIYLSENPSALSPSLTKDNVFADRNWQYGIANFYGMTFKELKGKFGLQAKKYVQEKNKAKTIKSKLITSNGYYLYPCYTFGKANMVGSTFNQGMCFFNSPTFWLQHTGNLGGLFMFKKISGENKGKFTNSKLFHDVTSVDEIVISTNVDDSGKSYIDGITNGHNITLYNRQYHNTTGKKSDMADDFTEQDIKDTSDIIGTINGVELFTYCLSMTRKKQDKKYKDIFKEKNFASYERLSNRHPEKKKFDEEYNMTIFECDGRVYCLLNSYKDVVVVEKTGFITCDGREIRNTNAPIVQRIEKYLPIFFKNWSGFVKNKRNKWGYNI